MRFLIFIFALALIAPANVRAADNKIIIKSDDGKVTEYEIPEDARNRPVEAREPEPSMELRRAPQDRPVAAKPAPEPEAAPRENTQQESVVAAPETGAVSTPEPAREKPQAEAAPVPEKNPPAESKDAVSEEAVVKEKAPAVVAKAPVPVPGRKPFYEPEITEAAYDLPSDSAIPQSAAVSIAIAHAPPASDFKVLRRMHEGVPVYAVAFKTEEGTHMVLVDARNGAVIAD